MKLYIYIYKYIYIYNIYIYICMYVYVIHTEIILQYILSKYSNTTHIIHINFII